MGKIRLFLSGDVMTGRGIDQILPHPCPPELYEGFVSSAETYVRLAEQRNGLIPRPATPEYIWGAALEALGHANPDLRIINLETAVTRSDAYLPNGINYRMSPENADCLRAAQIDCCVLANNHVLDWGQGGLQDTLVTLHRLGIQTSGAGGNAAEADAPAVLTTRSGTRVIVAAVAAQSSGTPAAWSAGQQRGGIRLTDLSDADVASLADQFSAIARPGDVFVVSVHWGPNWGYDIDEAEQAFARALIQHANVSIVHGHSSHHPKAVELFHSGLIFYGCGDFLNDYEGIPERDTFRSDLSLGYLVDVDTVSREVADVDVIPFRIRRFQLTQASGEERAFLVTRLDNQSARFGTGLALRSDGHIAVVFLR